MEEILKKIIGNDLLSEDTKAEVAETFKHVLEEAKISQETKLREEFARLYDADKGKLVESISQIIEERLDEEVKNLRSEMIALEKQRLAYAKEITTVREEARAAVEKRLKIQEAIIRQALSKEMAEVHEDLRTNRRAALKAIAETKTRAEADRKAFREQGARVLEHIINDRLNAEMETLKEDIRAAKENDFGRRIFEAFIGEARRGFFNASKEHKNLLTRIATMESNHKTAMAARDHELQEAKSAARHAKTVVAKLQESAVRSKKMNDLLATVPAGSARTKMRTLLESTDTVNLDKTFNRFKSDVLDGIRKPIAEKAQPLNFVEVRTGGGTSTLAESVDSDEDIVRLRARAGIRR